MAFHTRESEPIPMLPLALNDMKDMYQNVELWTKELLAVGWFEVSPTVWQSPEGKRYRGPFGAWKQMKFQCYKG